LTLAQLTNTSYKSFRMAVVSMVDIGLCISTAQRGGRQKKSGQSMELHKVNIKAKPQNKKMAETQKRVWFFAVGRMSG